MPVLKNKILGRSVMDWLIVLIAFYALALALLYCDQRSLMYFPDNNRPDRAQWGAEKAEVASVKTADGLQLQGWYFPPRPGIPVIIYYHGNAGNIGPRAEKIRPFTDVGYGVLLAEYRGYGGNPGSPSEQGLYADARAYIDFLEKGRKISEGEIIIYGESIGTGVAVQMAAEHPRAAALVLEAPFSSTVDVAARTYFFVPVSLLMKDRYDSAAKIGNVKMPKLFVQGDMDSTVPIALGEKLFGAAPEPKKFVTIKEAGHNDLYEHGAALYVLNFLTTINSK